jgi:hypothetical protein
MKQKMCGRIDGRGHGISGSVKSRLCPAAVCDVKERCRVNFLFSRRTQYLKGLSPNYVKRNSNRQNSLTISVPVPYQLLIGHGRM